MQVLTEDPRRLIQGFEVPGGEVGCLLLHGFAGTPLQMVPLAAFLHARGLTVVAPALAGHGADAAAIATTTADDWLASAADALSTLRQRCPTTYLVGLSAGGAIALALARSEEVAGVVAISTPIGLRPAARVTLRTVGRVVPLLPVLYSPKPRHREMRPFAHSYGAIPTAAARSLSAFLHRVERTLGDVRVPALIVQGRRDYVIPRQSARRIYAALGSTRKTLLWLPRSGHVATLDVEREVLFEHIGRFMNGGSP